MSHTLKKAPINLDNYLPYLVNRLGGELVEWYVDRALRDRDLTIGAGRVLAVLHEKGRQRLTDLSDLTTIETSTLSRLVTRLVSRGLVKRARRVTNSREISVELSSKGHALTEELIPSGLELEAAASLGISQRDLAIVKRSLRKMHENVSKSRCS